MNKLLSAGFSRLWKNKVFWGGVLLMPCLLVFVLVSNYRDMMHFSVEARAAYILDTFLPGCFMFIGCFTAIFAALFLGTEYSDGTIRNKLVVGHSRVVVYLSSLILCIVSSLLVCVATALVTLIAGIRLFGIIGFFTLLFISIYIMQRLEAPEFIESSFMMNVDGEIVQGDPFPNPAYLRGTARAVYEFFADFLPTSQSFRIVQSGALPHPWQLCFYSVLISVVSTLGGIFLFCKKDLK